MGNRIREKTTENTETGNSNVGGSVPQTPTVRVSTFQYDKAYRLVKAGYDQGKYEEFSYDNSGNRLKKTSNLEGSNTITTAYVYDNDNRLLCEQKPSGNINYIYDRAGRLVKKTEGDKVERYTFNQRDLMTKYTVEKGGNIIAVSEYTYDVNNLRTVKKETPETPGSMGNSEIRFVYDGNDILFEGGTFHLTKVDQRSGYEAEIQPLRIAVHIKDANGSIRGDLYDAPITISAGTFNYQTFNYTVFGEQLSLAGTVNQDNSPDSSPVKTGVSFKGHYFDDSSGLYYAVARYFDPSSNRFITPDPIQDPSKRYAPAGLNRYVYGINNPLYTDHDGQWFLIDDLVKFVAGAIIGTLNAAISNIGDLMNGTMSLTDYFANMGLGGISGGASMWMNGNGIPLYISLSTRGYSAGVGYNFGGLINVGGGFHSDWSGQNYGFSANVGLGAANNVGPGIGLSMGADYSKDNGWSNSIGANVSFGSSGGSFSLGGNLNFNKEGYAGFGLNAGLSGANSEGYSAGANYGLNFDKNGQYSGGSFGLTGSYTGYSVNEFGAQNMTYSEAAGINFTRDGKVSGYGNYSATRTINNGADYAYFAAYNSKRFSGYGTQMRNAERGKMPVAGAAMEQLRDVQKMETKPLDLPGTSTTELNPAGSPGWMEIGADAGGIEWIKQ